MPVLALSQQHSDVLQSGMRTGCAPRRKRSVRGSAAQAVASGAGQDDGRGLAREALLPSQSPFHGGQVPNAPSCLILQVLCNVVHARHSYKKLASVSI